MLLKKTRGQPPAVVQRSSRNSRLHERATSRIERLAISRTGRPHTSTNAGGYLPTFFPRGAAGDSRQPGNQNIIYLVGEDSTAIRALVREIFQCQEIQFRHSGTTDKEVAEFVRGQSQRADALKRDLETALNNAFVKGSFVFRGKPQAVATCGTELLAACKTQLASVAADVFGRFKEAPISADTNAAEKLLQVRDLSTITSATNLLGLVQKKGQATSIHTAHPALVSVLDYLRKHGEVDGRKLLDDFARAPFGWYKDTTRYLIAALLIAGSVRLRVGAQWIKVSGDKAIEALKSNVAFGKVDIATNEDNVPQEALLRAATRLLQATGKTILPMPQNISRGVQEEFPRFQRDFAAMAAELTAAGLPGADRAGRMLQQLSQILQGDASEAPTILGAEECELVDNLLWAREVRKAFESKLDDVARECTALIAEIPKLPRVGAAEGLIRDTESIRAEITEFLSRVDFFKVGADLRQRLTALQGWVKTAAGLLGDQFQQSLTAQAELIRSSASWQALPEADRASFSETLDALRFPAAADLEGIRRLVNARLEVDTVLSTVRSQIDARIRQIEEEKKRIFTLPPNPEPTPVDPVRSTPAQPRRITVRRSYAAGELPPLIADLESAHQAGASVNLDLQ